MNANAIQPQPDANVQGVEYLRNYLHLAEDVSPNTHKDDKSKLVESFGAPRSNRFGNNREGGSFQSRDGPRGRFRRD